jgi:ATP-dependent DNA helicase RecG
MTEHQQLEWKESWRDEHLKWVCAFANGEGGMLVIGRNDRGQVVGPRDARKLLEELPNRIRDLLGVVAEVNLRTERGKYFIEIVTPAYPTPISYRGHYYQRSGSTLQELKGAALDRFLLRRYGRTWDGTPIPGGPCGICHRQRCRASAPSRHAAGGSMPPPSQKRTQDLLFTKYLKAAITYEGILRVERFPVPREAMREALLNAVVHRDYSVPAPLQIRVYNERLVLVNPAVLPDGWTQASLLAPHYSHPYNPDIANAFFRAGEIETWGRGIQRIFDTCRAANTPAPVVRFEANGLWIEFPFSPDYLAHLRGTPVETLERTPHRILQTPLRTHNPELRRRARVNQKARGYSDTHVVPEVCQKHGISVTSFCVLRQADVLRQRGKESRKGKGFVQPLKAHEHWHVDVA